MRGGDRDYDANSRMIDRTRHVVVGPNEIPLALDVTGGEFQDRDAAGVLLLDTTRKQPTLVHVWADQG